MKKSILYLFVFLLFAYLISFFTGCASPYNNEDSSNNTGQSSTKDPFPQITLPFYDDFNRADSEIVGNEWVESDGDGDPGSISRAAISDNKLCLAAGWEKINDTESQTDIPGIHFIQGGISGNFKETINFYITDAEDYYINVYFSTIKCEIICSISENIMEIQELPNDGDAENPELRITENFNLTANTNYKTVIEKNGSIITLSILDDFNNVLKMISLNRQNFSENVICFGITGGAYDSINKHPTMTFIDSLLIEKL